MTAINIVRQPQNRCVVAVVDAAHYTMDGVVRGIGTKITTAAHWPGLITSRGGTIPAAVLAANLLSTFQTFDALVVGVAAEVAKLVQRYQFDEWGADFEPELIFAGWSAERDRPESYVLNISDELPPGEVNIPKGILPIAYQLQALPACTAGPPIPLDLMRAAGVDGVRAGGSLQECVSDLEAVIELQRRRHIDGVAHCFVGGFAELTIVRPDAIEQRILFRWPDLVGEKIVPAAAGWPVLRRRAAETAH